jgi:lipoprotein NlpD
MDSVLTRIIYSLLACALVACGGNSRAPVEDRYASSKAPSGYTVQRGDTLYSIAFRYGLDSRKVAAANGIAAPYTIFPGQKIALREAAVAPVVQVDPPPAVVKSPAVKRPTPVRPAPSTGTSTAPVAPPATTKSPATTARAPAPRSTSNGPPAAVGGPVRAWRWPTSGRVTRRYSSSVHKGIDIGGKRGDGIHAVAAGTVVYAGTGIVGFGELLIIKHNETYLSAYGHNSRLLVTENSTVRAGQKIAEKGSSGTDTVKLHFEIRKEGKPVDPLKLLPRR